MKIIHLTDTHLGYHDQKIYNRDPLPALEKAIKSINSEHSDAAMMVITGDLAHSGHPDAYQILHSALSKLTIPYHLVIGNHDDRAVISTLFPDFKLDEYGFAQKVIETEKGAFILLDSVEPGTHAGVYSSERFEWLQNKLTQYKKKPVYIFMHHAPFDTGIPAMDLISLDKQHSIKLGDMLESHGQVKHLFFGHYHRPIAGQWRGIAFSTLRGTNHQGVLDLYQSDVISACFEEPQYCVVLLEDDRTLVHYHDYMHVHDTFDLGSPTDAEM